ncbi:hypothetical protein VTI74DRAFT_931 [Chaetomium olivicolor]
MASTLGLSLRHNQVRTCNLCRQRRVKCDRQVPQCSNCVRAEATCIYPPGRGRAPKRPRRDVAPQLTERLSRLESIISQLGASARETSHSGDPSDAQSFDQDFSRLKVDESKSYYVSNALWVTLADEVEELRDLLFEPANEDAGYDTSTAPSPYPPSITSSITTGVTPPSYHLGLNAAVFGYRALSSSLQDFHPSLPQAVTLFTAFTDNVAPLVRIFHMPTLTRIYWDAVASLDSLDKHAETLLFAIHYSAVISLTPEQCLSILDENRDAALERYRFAVEQALARGNLLNTQNMTMLQAAVLFLSALPNEDESRAAWSLTSLIYHIARTMGLHRDGTVFGLKPFETELRRRLWWQICIIDSRSSEYHCNEPIARAFASDTKPPLHIDDADLWPGMVEPPAERWDRATDMTLSLIRCEAIQTGFKLGLIKEKQLSDSTGDDSREDASQKRRALIQHLEARLRDKYLPICDTSVPFQLLSSAVARIILGRFWLITKYSVQASREIQTAAAPPPPPNNNNLNKTETPDRKPNQHQHQNQPHLENTLRNELFQTSISILELSGMLLTNPAIAQFTWYSKTHIQWGAMAFVLSELCTQPLHPPEECDKAWACVTTVYDGWRGDGGGGGDSGGCAGNGRRNQGGDAEGGRTLALWRPIRRLMAKARYVRELQRMELCRPRLGGGGMRPAHIKRDAVAAATSFSPAVTAACHPVAQYPPLAATMAASLWYTPSPPSSSSHQQTAAAIISSMSTPESVLSVVGGGGGGGGGSAGPSSIPYNASGAETADALQRVLGTETLGPFMDLLPDWSWALDDGETAAASSFAGFAAEVGPGLG